MNDYRYNTGLLEALQSMLDPIKPQKKKPRIIKTDGNKFLIDACDGRRFLKGYPETCQWSDVAKPIQNMLIKTGHVQLCKHHKDEYVPWFGQCQWCEFDQTDRG